MNNIIGADGQNSPTPAEKIFGRHFILSLNGIYYDPSYGLTYTNAADFQAQAVAGFAVSNNVTNGTYQMNVKLPTNTVEIDISPFP